MTDPHSVRRGGPMLRVLQLISLVAIVIFLVVWVFPIIWTVLTSLKYPVDIFAYPPSLIFDPTVSNYRQVLTIGSTVLPSLGTSIVVTTATTLIAMITGLGMAYAFARLRFPGRRPLMLYSLFTYLVPRVGLVIPMFVIMRRLNLTDNLVGLTIVYLSFTVPMAVWLMVAYFENIPPEMEEAARVDGATRLQALWHVILPQVRGGIGATTVFVFVMAWNEFLLAIVLGGNNVRPVTVAMYNFISVEQTPWGLLTATAVLAMLPVVVLGLAAQREIVRGLTAGAVK